MGSVFFFSGNDGRIYKSKFFIFTVKLDELMNLIYPNFSLVLDPHYNLSGSAILRQKSGGCRSALIAKRTALLSDA